LFLHVWEPHVHEGRLAKTEEFGTGNRNAKTEGQEKKITAYEPPETN
jgi:hypothetical protein